ncbi:phage Gp37/Gp68 family protein [Nostoc sp. CHAB 5844]|nr:phage Gp37/Gp68 family protein [Nostoc sp. CHAB 5844]
MPTNIEWTDLTDNIIRAKDGGWWCQKISPGCAKCYSEKLNQNTFFGGNKQPYTGQPPELILDTEAIRKWGFQTKPKKHFVASMTDVFGEWVPRHWQREMLDGMFAAPKQTFQILTKRPEIMLSSINEWLDSHGLDKLPNNIWTGVSTENRHTLEQRSPILAQIPADIRFWSVEPLLEDLGNISQFLKHTQWLIVGGESGPNSRPCHLEWLQSIVDQCQSADVSVFVKQLGANAYLNEQQFQKSDKKGCDIAKFPTPLQVREFPNSVVS